MHASMSARRFARPLAASSLRLALLLSALGLWPAAVPAQDIFETNADGNTIGEYTTSGATVDAALVSDLDKPYGLALSGSDLFVANYNNGTIGEYTTSGAVVNATLISRLDSPAGIAVSGGNLFVVDSGTGTVGEYDATTGAVVNATLISGCLLYTSRCV